MQSVHVFKQRKGHFQYLEFLYLNVSLFLGQNVRVTLRLTYSNEERRSDVVFAVIKANKRKHQILIDSEINVEEMVRRLLSTLK